MSDWKSMNPLERLNYEEQKLAPKVIEELKRENALLVKTLRDALEKMESDELVIEHEFGRNRSLKQLEAEGILADEIVAARKVLKATE